MERLNVVFATDGLPFSGDTLQKRALGGSETAMIYVAREMARMGHYVRVYCNCDNPGWHDNVRYHHNQELEAFRQYSECDVFIVSRHYNFLGAKYNSKLNILWNHDICSNPNDIACLMWNIDFLWCLSDYHKQDYLGKNPQLEKFIKIAPNGFDPLLTHKAEEKKHRIMFTSRPERGLLKALDLYEQLNDKDLEFLACNYETIDVPEVRKMEECSIMRIQELVKKGFPVKIGRFTKAELYKHIAESKAVLYPTQFPEIFCINAIEAQANGTPFITTNDFALNETVGYPGVELDDDYDANILEYLIRILYKDECDITIEAGINHVEKYKWSTVVNSMMGDIVNHFETRSQDKEAILKRLIYESDLINAEQYALHHNLEFDSSMLDHLRETDAYKDAYEDENTHEQGLLSVDQAARNPRVMWLANQVKQDGVKSMLDYACHTGTNAFMALLENTELNLTGYDISKKAIDKAKIRLDQQFNKMKDRAVYTAVEPEAYEFESLHLGEILEHVEKHDTFLNELEQKYCKKGGKVYITLPRGAWEWLTVCRNEATPIKYHVHSFDLDDIIHMLHKKPDFKHETTSYTEGYFGESLGHYLISYTADHEPVKKELNRKKWLTSRPYADITACIISHNSEKTIETMFDTMYQHVDAITIALDHEPGENAELERRITEYDKGGKITIKYLPERIVKDNYGFANARNFSAADVNSKWIFWIDSDEKLILTDHMHKFLDSDFCNAFAIPQHHQLMDSFIQADLPNRIYRNGAGEFYGYIHEQVMTKGHMNKCLTPSIRLSCADIINGGELTENMRRDKALGRNLSLLQVDAEQNVDKRISEGLEPRKLTMILIMRDFVNRIKWSYEQFGRYDNDDSLNLSLPKIMALWNQFYKDEPEPLYRNEAMEQVNQALLLTGKGTPIAIKIGTDENAHNTRTLVIPNGKVKEFIECLENIS